jgi:electron transfer flavoprotein beta subunit
MAAFCSTTSSVLNAVRVTSSATTKEQLVGAIPKAATAWYSAMDELDESHGLLEEATQSIYVLMKWVGLRPDVDQLTGTIESDDRLSGASLADRAALELALQFGALTNLPVHVLSVGPLQSEAMLRDALACGAAAATLIQTTGSQPSSLAVAHAIAQRCDEGRAAMIFSGDWSMDRGSASVPPLVAYLLGIDSACGLVRVQINPEIPEIDAERRLDGGRREVLHISGPAVLSVEGSVANLRRASINGVLNAKSAVISAELFVGKPQQPGTRVDRIEPHRPAAPNLVVSDADDPRDRAAFVLGLGMQRNPPVRLTLDADTAAELILRHLKAQP